MNIETLSDCVSRHLRVELACRQCSHVATADPRALLRRFRRHGGADSFDEVGRRSRCSQCDGKRLTIRGVRPPRAESAPGQPRFVFVLNNEVAGPKRPTLGDAIEDAIDAGHCEYLHGHPYFSIFGRVVNLGVE